jgi:hypothetical protein
MVPRVSSWPSSSPRSSFNFTVTISSVGGIFTGSGWWCYLSRFPGLGRRRRTTFERGEGGGVAFYEAKQAGKEGRGGRLCGRSLLVDCSTIFRPLVSTPSPPNQLPQVNHSKEWNGMTGVRCRGIFEATFPYTSSPAHLQAAGSCACRHFGTTGRSPPRIIQMHVYFSLALFQILSPRAVVHLRRQNTLPSPTSTSYHRPGRLNSA